MTKAARFSDTYRNADGLLIALKRVNKNPYSKIGLRDNQLRHDATDAVVVSFEEVGTEKLNSSGHLRVTEVGTSLVNTDKSISVVQTLPEDEDIGLYTTDKKLRVLLGDISTLDPFHTNGALRVVNGENIGVEDMLVLENGTQTYITESLFTYTLESA